MANVLRQPNKVLVLDTVNLSGGDEKKPGRAWAHGGAHTESVVACDITPNHVVSAAEAKTAE